MTPARRLPGRTPDWAPLAALVVAAAVVGAVLQVERGFIDLEVYRFGGSAVLHGQSLYAGPDPATGLPFTYPPFAALLLAPVAAVPAWVAASVWTAASVAALAVLLHLVLDATGRAVGLPLLAGLTAAALLLEPVWQSLSFGQVNLFLAVAVALDLLRPDRRWSGVLLGVAAGVKLTPLLPVALLVLVGRRGAAGRAVAAFGATVLLAGLARPGDSLDYWTDVLWDPSRIGGVAFSSNQSVQGVLARVLGHEPPTLLWAAVAGLAAGVVLLVAAAWWRRGDRALGLVLTVLAMLLASPISWSHHWVWAAPAAVVLWRRAGRRAAAAWSALFVSGCIWWPPHRDDREHAWGVAEHLVGDAYVWAALLLAGWAAAQLVRAGSTRPETSPSEIRSPEVPGAV